MGAMSLDESSTSSLRLLRLFPLDVREAPAALDLLRSVPVAVSELLLRLLEATEPVTEAASEARLERDRETTDAVSEDLLPPCSEDRRPTWSFSRLALLLLSPASLVFLVFWRGELGSLGFFRLAFDDDLVLASPERCLDLDLAREDGFCEREREERAVRDRTLARVCSVVASDDSGGSSLPLLTASVPSILILLYTYMNSMNRVSQKGRCIEV